MHTLSTSFILGYHGCDRDVAERILAGDKFIPSTNDYDWLGHGIYFWEANPRRGMEFAQEIARRKRGASRVLTPAVVGAVVDLGLCLDLTTSDGIEQARLAYNGLVAVAAKSSTGELPENNRDGLRRPLDCAVLNMVHAIREADGFRPIDTVKGTFIEGEPIYRNASFFAKTHIQICVRNSECIKGVFRVPQSLLEPPSTVANM